MGLFELIYFLGYRIDRRFGLKNQKSLPVRVISIGNLTTGGTGKTPAAIALALEAKRRGLNPCILTRGYKGKAKGPTLVSADMKAEDAGDEPLLMAHKGGGIPVIKGKSRFDSGMFALSNLHPTPDIFILDDGFQHWRLKRDVDILLIDSINPFDDQKLLPIGRLREPISEMKRADIIVITRGKGRDNLKLMDIIRKHNPHASIFEAAHNPSHLTMPGGIIYPLESLAGSAVYAFCGIASPEYFRGTLEGLGVDIKGFRAFSDHHRYTVNDIARLETASHGCGAEWIVTTEKDMMRLKGLGDMLPQNLVSLGIEFDADAKLFDIVFEQGG